MLAYIVATVYEFQWWHLPAALAIWLIGLAWLAFYAAGFLTALDISRRCANTARIKGLDVRYYARLGALYSILSIGLGIYLIRKLQGTPTSSFTIRTYYVILFVSWLALILHSLLSFSTFQAMIGILLSFDLSSIIWILTVPIGAPLWTIAIALLLVKKPRTDTGNAAVPALTSILPFVFAFPCSTIPGLLLIYHIFFQ